MSLNNSVNSNLPAWEIFFTDKDSNHIQLRFYDWGNPFSWYFMGDQLQHTFSELRYEYAAHFGNKLLAIVAVFQTFIFIGCEVKFFLNLV